MGRPKKAVSDIDSTRCRNWTIVLYPESAPANWRELLDDDLCIEWVESPLHDKDINADGTPKKPHWHLLLMFGSVKSYDQVQTIAKKLNSPIPKRVHNVKSLIRYMIHMDNPEKHQYDRRLIIPHGGVDLDSVFLPSNAEELSYLKDIFTFIYNYNVFEFCDLVNHYIKNYDDDHLQVLKQRHSLISSYITSLRNKNIDNSKE